MVESPSPVLFRKRVVVALRDTVIGNGKYGLIVGLDDLSGLPTSVIIILSNSVAQKLMKHKYTMFANPLMFSGSPLDKTCLFPIYMLVDVRDDDAENLI